MIDQNSITELLTTYKKYGWLLRRVLLTERSKAALGSQLRDIFGGVPVIAASIDAAWFSRPPKPGLNPWEIRHLSPHPYALVEHIDENSPDFEEALASVESRLRMAVARIS